METEAATTEPPPLVFRGRLSQSDVVYMVRYCDRVNIRISFRILFSAWIGFIAYGGLHSIFDNDLQPALFASLLVLALLLGVPYLRVWMERQDYWRHPEKFVESEVVLSSQCVGIHDQQVNRDLHWSNIGTVAVTREGLLFLTRHGKVLFWLPERLLPNNVRQSVIALVHGQGVRTVELASLELPRFTLFDLFLATALIAVGLGGMLFALRQPEYRQGFFQDVVQFVTPVVSGGLLGAGCTTLFHKKMMGALFGVIVGALVPIILLLPK